MAIKANLHPVLTDGAEITLDVEGSTVGECVKCIVNNYPHMEEKIYAAEGKLKYYIEILVNGESTFPEELMYPVKDGDILSVLVMIFGR